LPFSAPAAREAHRRLREISLAENCKVHDLIHEGIVTVLKKRGFTRINRGTAP
jgi:hypothetical protein